ncbi:hypothetical protein ACOI9F_13485, partial [Corynebacterium striatum]|uniref:hypothetical protein n=1 Tax=Corynebacterium striatum TaxID=43770 RepID=UPI003B5A78C1
LRQDAILHQANDAVLRILIKFSWHVPDFPIYSNGTKPGTLHRAFNVDLPNAINFSKRIVT